MALWALWRSAQLWTACPGFTDVDQAPAPIPLAWLAQGSLQTSNNYFNEAIMTRQDSQALQPFRTFTDTCVAFHLSQDPSFKQMSVDEATEKYRLPGLCPTLADFIHHYAPSNSVPYLIGGWCSTVAHPDVGSLRIQIWTGVCLQLKSFHNLDEVMPSKLVNARPPCDDWPLGLYNGIIVNNDRSLCCTITTHSASHTPKGTCSTYISQTYSLHMHNVLMECHKSTPSSPPKLDHFQSLLPWCLFSSDLFMLMELP